MNGGGLRVRRELAGQALSVRAARTTVECALREWGLVHLVEPAALLTSELATNAVLHAQTDFCVEVSLRGGVVRISVSDCSPTAPTRRRHGVSAGTGRGLALIATLATGWGTEPAPGPWAKTVWFELPVEPGELPDPGAGALLL